MDTLFETRKTQYTDLIEAYEQKMRDAGSTRAYEDAERERDFWLWRLCRAQFDHDGTLPPGRPV